MYMYKNDFDSNNQLWFICHKTKPKNQFVKLTIQLKI